ncbi:F-box/WD repeat-containing protein 2 isoform X1 [Hydra vulgaris]|uniref:F-box/WD repeat-containing protein 2 isoform X1 n=1 Tax=Hydra vulgaris TaxID=6087 RepID=A0ABM4CFP9_HYDVU
MDVCSISIYEQLPPDEQLVFIESLLRVSKPEVKYRFLSRVQEITKYDIISDLPQEIVDKILLLLDLNTLLKCRQVCFLWANKVHKCDEAWLNFVKMYSIDPHAFFVPPKQYNTNSKPDSANMQVIGERLFILSMRPNQSFLNSLNSMAYTYIMGRKLLVNLKNHACFQLIIDHDSRGSNVSMTMDSQIVVYAREDRHIVVKYSNFPHKKICIFEAHQCVDLKIYGDFLITAGYDRTIKIWYWKNGHMVASLEGSIKPVYSIDIADNMLFSSDGRHIITWNIQTFTMLVKTPCFENGHIQEVKVVNPSLSNLCKCYDNYILITRSNRQLKVWQCMKSGALSFLNDLVIPNCEVNSFQPFICVHKDVVACSSEHGVCLWSLIDFKLIRCIPPKLCHPCAFNQLISSKQPTNCRVILLYYSHHLTMQYLVHKNKFQMAGVQEKTRLKVNWKFPSDEKWPWSHRKPGMACSVLNAENGLTTNVKVSMFVATQAKKIYCTFFDASDFDYTVIDASNIKL